MMPQVDHELVLRHMPCCIAIGAMQTRRCSRKPAGRVQRAADGDGCDQPLKRHRILRHPPGCRRPAVPVAELRAVSYRRVQRARMPLRGPQQVMVSRRLLQECRLRIHPAHLHEDTSSPLQGSSIASPAFLTGPSRILRSFQHSPFCPTHFVPAGCLPNHTRLCTQGAEAGSVSHGTRSGSRPVSAGSGAHVADRDEGNAGARAPGLCSGRGRRRRRPRMAAGQSRGWSWSDGQRAGQPSVDTAVKSVTAEELPGSSLPAHNTAVLRCCPSSPCARRPNGRLISCRSRVDMIGFSGYIV